MPSERRSKSSLTVSRLPFGPSWVCVCVFFQRATCRSRLTFAVFYIGISWVTILHCQVLPNAASWLFVYEEEEMAASSVMCTEHLSSTVGFRK